MSKVRGFLTGLVFTLMLSACGGHGNQPQNATPAANTARITIENNSSSTADIFIVYSDQAFRVEQVFGGSTTTVTMPRFVAPTGSIRVLVDPIGSTSAYLSDPVSYRGNEDFRLTIEETLYLSNFVPVARRR